MRSARPGQELGPAGIPDANGPGLRALVTAAGGEPIDLGIARDDLDDVLARLRGGLAAGADALIVSGGVSVGPYDVVKTAIETIGRIDLWRVAVQPGKPFAFGTTARPGGGAPVLLFGLPGNPVSSAVTFELFVRPAIRALAGRHDLLRPVDRAVLGEPVAKSHGRRAFIRVDRRDRRDRRSASATRVAASSSSSRAGRGATSSRPSQRQMPSRSSPRPTTAFLPAPRSPCGGSTAHDDGERLTAPPHPDPGGPMERPQPRAERRRLSHMDRAGRPRMVDVSDKPVTARRAVAEAAVAVSPETMSLVIDGGGTKGDVLGVAELAGVMGGKRTSELIPLCHPLALTDLVVAITPDRAAGVLRIRAEAATTGQTGVEMEAMTAASVAALTIYDMVKGVERGVEIQGVRLVSKTGGKSGTWVRQAPSEAPAHRPKPRPGARVAGRVGSKRKGAG